MRQEALLPATFGYELIHIQKRKPELLCHSYEYKEQMVGFIKTHEGISSIVGENLALRYPDFSTDNMRQVPVIRKQEIDLLDIDFINFQNSRQNENGSGKNKTVGFFMDDCRIERVCNRPWNYVAWLSQYKQVLSPDLSCYFDEQIEEQWVNIYCSRLVGAFWQNCGLTVIATVSWGDSSSYDFCFEGLEKGAVVAVSTNGTNGTRAARSGFLAGFIELCRQIEPQCVICYCTPYPEMYKYAQILPLEHEGNKARKLARWRSAPGQLSFQFELLENHMGGV